MNGFDAYIENVKGYLDCVASNEFKNKFITYTYTIEQVESNIDYFNRCMLVDLSPYKALLFFGDYLKGGCNI